MRGYTLLKLTLIKSGLIAFKSSEPVYMVSSLPIAFKK